MAQPPTRFFLWGFLKQIHVFSMIKFDSFDLFDLARISILWIHQAPPGPRSEIPNRDFSPPKIIESMQKLQQTLYVNDVNQCKSVMFPLCHYISPIYLPYNIIPGVLGALKSAKFTEVNDTSRVEQVKPMY